MSDTIATPSYHRVSSISYDRDKDSSSVNEKRGEEWTLSNLKTIVNWLNLASMYILLLNHSIEYYSTVINQVTIGCLILSTISSTVSFSHFSVTDIDYPGISLGLKFVFTLTSIITALLTGYLKVARAKEKLEDAMAYQTKWMLFATELSSQLQLPIPIRTNALRVIINSKDQFKQLFHTRFVIPECVKEKVAIMLEEDAIRERDFKIKEKEHHRRKSVKQQTTETLSSSPIGTDDWVGGCCRKKIKHTDLTYIYDSNRLNIYFILKDLIYNEIKGFEIYMKQMGLLPKTKRLRFVITPSRIAISIVDSDSEDHYSFVDLEEINQYDPVSSTSRSSIPNNIIQRLDQLVEEMINHRVDNNDETRDSYRKSINDSSWSKSILKKSKSASSIQKRRNASLTPRKNIPDAIPPIPLNDIHCQVEQFDTTQSDPRGDIILEIKRSEERTHSSDSNHSDHLDTLSSHTLSTITPLSGSVDSLNDKSTSPDDSIVDRLSSESSNA